MKKFKSIKHDNEYKLLSSAKADESKEDAVSRSPRSTEPSILPYGGKFGGGGGVKGDLLPEHVDLGLRLTVGEDVVQKPFLPSTQASSK